RSWPATRWACARGSEHKQRGISAKPVRSRRAGLIHRDPTARSLELRGRVGPPSLPLCRVWDRPRRRSCLRSHAGTYCPSPHFGLPSLAVLTKEAIVTRLGLIQAEGGHHDCLDR